MAKAAKAVGGVVRKKPRISPNGHVLPAPIPAGEIFTDVIKNKWRLGKSIGVGGFGEIYVAWAGDFSHVTTDANYVIKVEPHSNGPLFAEMHFYHRAAKGETISNWMIKKKLDFLGMPRFVASGSHEYNNTKYRFMVMDRYGDDIQKLWLANHRKFSLKTAFTLGIRILDILEYIHSHGYIHADIKGSNLLLGYGAGRENEVYLVDFGLACRYLTDGKHKEYREDPRKAHDGTIEYTSRDAHVGAHSRRGDVEILGYNILQWLCGRLPWETNLKDPEYVKAEKNRYMKDIPKLMRECFQGKSYPAMLEAYIKTVANMGYLQEPDYDSLRRMFRMGLKDAGLTHDLKLDFAVKLTPTKRKHVGHGGETSNEENLKGPAPPKKPRSGIRKPCKPSNRIKKSSTAEVRSGVVSFDEDSLSKDEKMDTGVPTPAMLQIMQKREQKLSATKPKRGRGRPRASSIGTIPTAPVIASPQPKRGRGRPRSSSFGVSPPLSPPLPIIPPTPEKTSRRRRSRSATPVGKSVRKAAQRKASPSPVSSRRRRHEPLSPELF